MQFALERRVPRIHVALYAFAALFAVWLGAAEGAGSIAGIAAALGALFAIAAVAVWRFGLRALVVIACIDGFIKHVAPSAVSFVLKDIVLALVAVGLAIDLALHPAARPTGRWHGLWAWALFVVFLATQLVHAPLGIAPALAGFRERALFAVLFIVGAVYFDRGRRLVGLANFTIAVITGVAVVGIVQYLMGPAWLRISPGMAKASAHYVTYLTNAAPIPGMHPLVYRSYSTLVDPAALGVACMFGVLYAIAALGRTRGTARSVTIAMLLISLVGLLLSETRAAMAGAAVGFMILSGLTFGASGTRSIALLGLLAFSIAIPAAVSLSHGAISDRVLDTSAVGYAAGTRERGSQEVLEALHTQPFGSGLGLAGAGGALRDDAQASEGIAIDNFYLAYLYEVGPFGLAIMLLTQVTLLVLTIRAYLLVRDGAARTVYAGMAAAQGGLLAAGAFMQGPFEYAPVAQLFWLFAGAVAMPQRAGAQDEPCAR